MPLYLTNEISKLQLHLYNSKTKRQESLIITLISKRFSINNLQEDH